MYDEVINILEEYLKQYKQPEKYSWQRGYFEQNSYSVWAMKELIRRIEIKKKLSPILVIEQFIHEMDEYSCKTQSSSFMFSIAKDAAEYIYDICLIMKERN